MDKVNCELYIYGELKLRAMICLSMQANAQQPPTFDGQTTNAVRLGAGTCSRSTSSTSGSIVKDVKGIGDPEGIIDAVVRRPIGMAAEAIGEEVVFLSSMRRFWPALGGQSVTLARGNSIPLFSSANWTCRQNGGLEPAICHIGKVINLARSSFKKWSHMCDCT